MSGDDCGCSGCTPHTYRCLCNDCDAIVPFQTETERDEVHDERVVAQCPRCNGTELCACSSCETDMKALLSSGMAHITSFALVRKA